MHLNVNDVIETTDPAEDLVVDSIQNLGQDEFIILSKEDEEYVQAYHHADGTFQLEYREGSYDKHYAALSETLGVEEVTQAFKAYLEDGPDWHSAWEWERVEFDEDFDGDV